MQAEVPASSREDGGRSPGWRGQERRPEDPSFLRQHLLGLESTGQTQAASLYSAKHPHRACKVNMTAAVEGERPREALCLRKAKVSTCAPKIS